jgi:hypothetical protein
MPSKPLLPELLGRLKGFTKQAVLAETLAGLGLIGAGLGVPYAYSRGREKAEEDEKINRLLAFGSGALTGYVAPKLLNKLTENKFGVMDTEWPQIGELPGLTDIPELSEYT